MCCSCSTAILLLRSLPGPHVPSIAAPAAAAAAVAAAEGVPKEPVSLTPGIAFFIGAAFVEWLESKRPEGLPGGWNLSHAAGRPARFDQQIATDGFRKIVCGHWGKGELRGPVRSASTAAARSHACRDICCMRMHARMFAACACMHARELSVRTCMHT
eukprot:366331-Chlamydomonas_euryale.AAC.19